MQRARHLRDMALTGPPIINRRTTELCLRLHNPQFLLHPSGPPALVRYRILQPGCQLLQDSHQFVRQLNGSLCSVQVLGVVGKPSTWLPRTPIPGLLETSCRTMRDVISGGNGCVIGSSQVRRSVIQNTTHRTVAV